MIRSFKIYVNQAVLYCIFLPYGGKEKPVTFDDVKYELQKIGLEKYDRKPLIDALDTNEPCTVKITEDIEGKVRGACWIEARDDDSIMLNMAAPLGKENFVSENDIRAEIHIAGFGQFYIFTDVIRRHLQSQGKDRAFTTFKCAERRDSNIEVTIAQDRKTAYIDYHPPYGGKFLTVEDMEKILLKHEVVYGVRSEKLQKLANAIEPNLQMRIATASDPVDGEDGKINYLFDAFGEEVGPSIDEKDYADFKDLNLFKNVEKGAPLVEIIPPTTGIQGTDVTGKPIPAKPGKEVKSPLGKGTTLSPGNPNLLIADIKGLPRLVGGKIVIEEVLTVDSVDYSTGNVEFVGNVIVRGTIKTGFTVKAEGDVTCQEYVDGGNIIAGGSIFLKRGIKGQGKSRLSAGKDIIAKFIEGASLEAEESVIVDEALIHSNTSAGERIVVSGTKGSIFGGTVKAGNLVKATFIGSEMAVQTKIKVGVNPHLLNELEDNRTTIKKKKSDYEKASRNHVALGAMKSKSGLSADKEELYSTLYAITEQLRSDIETIASTIASLEEDLQRCSEGRIEAVKTIYPGVTLTIKTASRPIKSIFHQAIFIKEGPDVVLIGDLAEPDFESETGGGDEQAPVDEN
ncbi:MAG TPA: FapA family protein [bacterium]|jgi:hypothetical protein